MLAEVDDLAVVYAEAPPPDGPRQWVAHDEDPLGPAPEVITYTERKYELVPGRPPFRLYVADNGPGPTRRELGWIVHRHGWRP